MMDLEQYKLIVESSPNMIWRSNISTACDYFNKTWLDFTGRTMGQEYGFGWAEGVHFDDLDRCVKIYLDGFNNRQAFEMNYRLKRFDGKYRWINDIGVPIYDKGNFIGFIGSCIDITEKVEGQSLLKKTELQAGLLNLSKEAIFAWELDGTIFYWNKGAEERYGFSSEEAVGASSHELLKTVFPVDFDAYKQDLSAKGVWNGELVHAGKDGSIIIADSKQQIIIDKERKIVLETNRDMTEQKKIEKEKKEALEASVKQKDDFLYLISHEFKTPSVIINTALQAIELICKDDISEKMQKYLTIIKANTNRQFRLVNNLLDITKMNSGNVKLDMSTFDIVYVSRSIVNSIVPYANLKQVNLHFISTISKKVLYLDEEKFERIMFNLLANALKFTPKGKSITVNVSTKRQKGKDFICIGIQDEGIGIPKDSQKIIFEKFGQVETVLSRQAEGTGLGLFLTKKYIDILGGKIFLKSDEGNGSLFTIMLPVAKQTECEDTASNSDNATMLHSNRIIQSSSIEFSDIYFD